MKIRTIEATAAVVSTVVAGVTAVVLIVDDMVFGHVAWWSVAVCTAVIFGVSYLVAVPVIRKFVIYKIKPIYQIVLSRNMKTRELEREFAESTNMVEDIRTELTTWAHNSEEEIERLKENERYRKEFLSNLSHELKTPIFNVQGYISTLLDGGLEDDLINRKYLERSEKSIDRLINIVTDIDVISRLESGVRKMRLDVFDVVALARDIAETLEMEASRRGMTISVGGSQTPLAPIYVKADKHYIGQVFVNLLTNSIRYGRDGGYTKVVFIDMFDKVMVEISDNGTGISREDIPRVFERFYRTDKSRSREQGGTGLGLAIVKHIIEAHKESITLRSELGEGSTFSFTLSKESRP